MNSLEHGFPEITDSFLSGQDIFYGQFNNINFYVEDTDQEHFYFNILKRLFPNIEFDKIFPLNGKDNVILEAQQNTGSKSKVYIVDLDFDEILEKKQEKDNLFYLKRYSIENYLIDKKSLYEIIRERNPKLKNNEIDALYNYNSIKSNWKTLLSELSSTFIIIQKYSLGKEYFGLNPPRDFNLNLNPPRYKNSFITDYFDETEVLLKNVDNRFTLTAQKRKLKKFYKSSSLAIKNIPGKYILNLLKYQLERLNLINQYPLETFTYKLSKECNISNLQFLKDEINEYVN